MVAPIVAAGGAKAAEHAGKALTGDIYTRRWTTKAKKKGQAPVEHTLRVNPVGVGIAAVGVGATALAGAVTLWALQLRAAPQVTTVEYGKWRWSDGSDASKVTDILKRGVAPTRQTGVITVWRLYVGGFVPYTVVPEGTIGAVQTTIPVLETASWAATETKEETRFAIQQRRGFTILGGDGAVLPSVSDTAKVLVLPGGPIKWLLNKIGR